jgi:Protein of unknown function (DUF3048) N-terminal domain/Protein of unknown function (DUF3048) C-terminal domain
MGENVTGKGWLSSWAARGLVAAAVIAVLAVGAYVVSTSGPSAPVGARSTATPGSAAPSAAATAGAIASPGSTPGATPTASSSPPVVVDVPDPLTGLLVTPAAASRHPIAVMIDDHQDARPQSGFNRAAVVFQAPAEGGIPRYMLIFQGTVPTAVGPIRSARQYFIEWAAGWNAMYVHFGGSYQALATLRAAGNGRLVWNADGFRWSPTYMWRIHTRVAPHNVYTDGAHLEALAKRISVPNDALNTDWTFVANQSPTRPTGNTITVIYPYESITFRYDPTRDAYLRYLNGSKQAQRDAADGQVVAPTNVIVIRMHFGPLTPNDTHGRLEAADVGHGDAWISTAGRSIHGTWRKASKTAPLLFFDSAGNPVTLQPGQTFIEVIPLNYGYSVHNGTPLPGSERDLSGRIVPD